MCCALRAEPAAHDMTHVMSIYCTAQVVLLEREHCVFGASSTFWRVSAVNMFEPSFCFPVMTFMLSVTGDHRRDAVGGPRRCEAVCSVLSPFSCLKQSAVGCDSPSCTCWQLSQRHVLPQTCRLRMSRQTDTGSRPTGIDLAMIPMCAMCCVYDATMIALLLCRGCCWLSVW